MSPRVRGAIIVALVAGSAAAFKVLWRPGEEPAPRISSQQSAWPFEPANPSPAASAPAYELQRVGDSLILIPKK